MTKSITKPELLNMFMHFCKDMSKVAIVSESDIKSVLQWYGGEWTLPCVVGKYGFVGGWCLDYAGCYGGWYIQQVDDSGGGISGPFGYRRHKTKEMYNMICFAREVVRLGKYGLAVG
jgi:hypothetical protein